MDNGVMVTLTLKGDIELHLRFEMSDTYEALKFCKKFDNTYCGCNLTDIEIHSIVIPEELDK